MRNKAGLPRRSSMLIEMLTVRAVARLDGFPFPAQCVRVR